MQMQRISVPLPPIPLRGLVSPVTDESYYDNPTGDYVWGPLDIGPLKPGQAYERIFDFGCGCGREARRLLLQTRDTPRLYVGVDINRGMIEWCQKSLAYNGFHFHHHDVWNVKYAPENSRNRVLPIAHLGSEFTLIEANSVFTHLHEDQTQFYLQEMRSMLSPRGMVRATWFFFNKASFPTMSEGQHTIFVSEVDTSHAVYYDWKYFLDLTNALNYRVARIEWSPIVGFHNTVYLAISDSFPDLHNETPPGGSVVGF